MRVMGFKKLSQTIGFDNAATISKYLGLSSSSDAIDTLMEELNKEYFFCINTHQIFRYTIDPDHSFTLTEVSIDGLRQRYMARCYMYNSIKKQKALSMNPADIFIEHPARRTVEAIVFEPDQEKGFYTKNSKSYLNLWTGWPWEPRKGDWSKLHHFLLHGAFDGDQASYDWFIKWLAFKIQNPGKLTEIAVIFYGINLVGKSFLCEFILPHLFGMKYSLPSSDLSKLDKDFNSQFQNKFFIHFCESNVAKINRKHVGNTLKKMITSTDLEIEAKRKDVIFAKNYCSIVFTTNDFIGVPIENDLRRFVAFEFGTSYLNRTDLFGQIEYEFLYQGMAEAFLYHLKYEINFGAFEKVDNVDGIDSSITEKMVLQANKAQLRELQTSAPKTDLLNEIEAASDSIHKKCIRIFIETGYINDMKVIADPDEGVYLSTTDFYQGCKDRIAKFGQDERGFSISLGRELVEMCSKTWTEPLRRKVTPNLRASVPYPIQGSYVYYMSRNDLSDRHFEFRGRRIKPRDFDESEAIIVDMITEQTALANKHL
jgi:Family of unknown function (DUF5906)